MNMNTPPMDVCRQDLYQQHTHTTPLAVAVCVGCATAVPNCSQQTCHVCGVLCPLPPLSPLPCPVRRLCPRWCHLTRRLHSWRLML